MSGDNAAFFARMMETASRIEAVKGESLSQLFRCSLHFPLLEAMASVVYPREGRSGVKVRKLIWRFGDWPEGDRVSMVLIARLLEEQPEPVYQAARAELRRRIGTWSRAHRVPLSQDPEYDDVRKLLGGATAVGPHKLQRFRHIQLLWDTRNAVVHVLEHMPWFALDLFEGEEPCYFPLPDGDGWGFPFGGPFYPEGFLKSLVITCARNLLRYCDENRIEAAEMSAIAAEYRWPGWLPVGGE